MAEKSLKKNAMYAMIRKFANIAFPIITFPYISRILNPDGIGKINFANSFVEYFIMLACMGLVSYACREAAKIRDDKTALNKFSREIILLNLISTLISYALLFIILFTVPKLSSYILIIIICSSKIFFEGMGLSWLYGAEEEYAYITIRSLIFQVISLACMFLFVKTKDDVLIYAVITVISSVGSNFCNMLYARKFINVFEPSKIELKKHLVPSFVFFGSTIAGKIYTTIDTMMLGFMTTDAIVGFYSAANKIINMVFGVIEAAITTANPRCSYLLEKNETEEYEALVEKSFDVSAMFSLPAMAGLFILSRPIILLFSGSEYLPALVPMRILTTILFLTSFACVLNSSILIPQRKEKYTLFSQLAGLLVNVILNFILIPYYSVIGAVIASVVSQVVTNIVLTIATWKFIKKRKLILSYIKYGIFTLIMCVPVVAIYLVLENIPLKTIICTIVGALTYFLCLAVTKNYFYVGVMNGIKNKLNRQK